MDRMDIDDNDLISDLERNVQTVLHRLAAAAATAQAQAQLIPIGRTVADERELMTQVIDSVNVAVANTVAVFARTFNEAKPAVHRLPPEALCHCFRWLPFPDLLTATHICRHWRVVALGDVSLWWNIRASDPDKLATLLERTQESPVNVELQPKSLDVDPRDRMPHNPSEYFLMPMAGLPVPRLGMMPTEATKKQVDSMWDVLVPHMPRVRGLHINRFWKSDALDRLLTTPAPALRRLSLNFVNAPGMGVWHLPPNLFGGVAPNFRDLSLDAVLFYKQGRLNPGDHLSLRRALHGLRRVEYKGSEHHLFHIAGFLGGHIREVILWLPPEPWREQFAADRPLFKILPRPQDVGQIAMVHGKVRTIHDTRFVREVNTVVTHEEAARGYLRAVMDAAAHRLLKLQLDEAYWNLVVGEMAIRAFPLLTDLNIVLTPRPGLEDAQTGQQQAQPAGPIFALLPAPPVPKCPALQALSFWGQHSSSRRRNQRTPLITVRANDLLFFVQQLEARPAIILRRGLTIAQDPEDLERLKTSIVSLTVQLPGEHGAVQ